MMGLRALGLVLLLLTSITLVQCQEGACKSKPCPRFTILSPSNDANYCHADADGTKCLNSEKSPYPYVSHNGQLLPNNSLVEVWYLYYADNVMGCHTDIETCCDGSRDDNNKYSHTGNWYFPNGCLVDFDETTSTYVHQSLSTQRVDLYHNGHQYSNNTLGVYCCIIDTLNGHNGCTEKSVCVGLFKNYIEDKDGNVEIKGHIEVDVTSRHDADVPVFDLIGTSHKAVATTAEWIIDGVKVPVTPVLKDGTTSEYFSKLTLRGRVERFASYTVFNKRSKDSTKLSFSKYKGINLRTLREQSPVNITANFVGESNDVHVTWDILDNINEITTGYRIFYEGDDGSQGSKNAPKEETSVIVEGLSKCVFYKIKVMAVSVYGYSKNSTAIGISPKPCSDTELLFELQFTPIRQYNTWTNSYAREINENIHSKLREHLWPTNVGFCCESFRPSEGNNSGMVIYRAFVDNPIVLCHIKEWKEDMMTVEHKLGNFCSESR